MSSYSSLTDIIAVPRVEGLALAPDGTYAVLTVATLAKDQTSYERALWKVPTSGDGAPVRLTRSAKGEGGAAFLSTGDLVFTSARPGGGDEDASQLWLLPANGGEARPVTGFAGGAGGVAATAADAPVAAFTAGQLPAAKDLDEDTALRGIRSKRKVNAIWHSTYPIRHWDHDLGPDHTHLFALDASEIPAETATAPAAPSAAEGDEESEGSEVPAPTVYPRHMARPQDLTPGARRWSDAPAAAVSPDGSAVLATLEVPEGRSKRKDLVRIVRATGAHTVVRSDAGVDIGAPTYSLDGNAIAYLRQAHSDPSGPTQVETWVADADGGNPRRVAEHWDRWPSSLQFSHDSAALVATADSDGRGPIFRIDLATDEVTQITTDDAHYSAVRVDRGTGDLVALRTTMLRPAHPVRVNAAGTVTELATPAPAEEAEATLTDVETLAEDGARVRGWLLTPPDASEDNPAPLLLWIHGGPLNSWNAWSWRWTPALAVARGYAVLLPDPALSTGYGLEFIARGWNSWGHKPFTDLLAITDAVEDRPEIDSTRTAAMGGSFGGYMANWVAGHTDRFDAIVTHASLWALDQFGPTTDHADYWQSIFTPEAMVEHSPHRAVKDISTPMLVIHGDKDYRVPIGEGLRLWAELAEHFAADDGTMVHRYLYFPDENHWILKPQHTVVWYEGVFAFLAQHVLGQEEGAPESLRISGA
ncbi:S9 family peptidase [Demequina globuliformis]|uniref:S9 family peptidase n=1 Tax=Demequina globuliformis TaxID=676202 RepID=UPI0007835A7C|nr:prolyl oligopeptidase family serine peptidase [Demequina globuliformis]